MCARRTSQPLRGITHGTGPQNQWDLPIVVAAGIVVALALALRMLLKPGERDRSTSKRIILKDPPVPMEPERLVRLFIDNDPGSLFAEFEPPVRFVLDTTRLPDGPHTLRIVARSTSGWKVSEYPSRCATGRTSPWWDWMRGDVVDGRMPITINAYGSGRADKFLVTGSETPRVFPPGCGPCSSPSSASRSSTSSSTGTALSQHESAARTDIRTANTSSCWWTPSTIRSA